MRRSDLEPLFVSVLGALALAAAGCSCPPPTSTSSLHPVAPTGASEAELALDCARVCAEGAQCTKTTLADGTLALQCSNDRPYHCAAGRRPRGMAVARRRASREPAVAMLASMAELEAASVFAFEGLADELVQHGAPAALVSRARRAAVEESRHARVIAAHARRRGGRVRSVRAAPATPRPLVDLAIENAREGCVLETFAALLAVHQSRAATDPVFRAAMTSIANDEISHAELARDVDAWARTTLGASDRARLDAAHANAWRDLERVAPSADLPELGIPGGATRAKMAAALRSALPDLCARNSRASRGARGGGAPLAAGVRAQRA